VSKRVDNIRIRRFEQDRRILPYNDAQIAVLMGISKSSYSSYINGRIPITHTFLQKFYTAFEEELQQLRKDNILRENDPEYKNLGYNDRVKDLENKCARLMESHQQISMEIYRLEKKLEDILDNKFETLLAQLESLEIKRKKKPGG